MSRSLSNFLLRWAVTALSLWVSTYVFSGIKFNDMGTLIVSALLLGFANAVIKPLLILLTLPITFFTFGLFLLVINAFIILLVSYFVPGFQVSNFGTALFASLFISALSVFLNFLLNDS